MKKIRITKIILLILCFHIFSINQCEATTQNEFILKIKENVLGINQYNSECDLNEDGIINIFDVIRIKQKWLYISERIDKIEADIASLKELYSTYDNKEVESNNAADIEKISQ